MSRLTTEADFIEAPSLMLEKWIRSPQVLASFARHYKTGEPIPADLVARMNRAAAFGRAGDVALQNFSNSLYTHGYFNFSYSDLARMRTGMSGSAPLHNVTKSW
jgi:Zn-dependent oligopeptidase